MMFSHMLVPTDGSGPSQAAVAVAARFARENGSIVTICHVIDRSGGFAYEGIGVDTNNPATVRGHAQQILDEAASTFAPQTRTESVLLEGDPIERILECASANRVDLIVMGTHGRSGLSRMALGSVTEAVLRRADVPVLTVKAVSR
jgi:nucleotide-binding universal stress UspA family protein